ncbi:MAG: CRISPR-associated endonuclease Cas2 [Candidatus Omnitrophota bacterium]
MSKKLNKILYGGKKIVERTLSDFIDSFLFLLYFSTPPYTTKVLSVFAPEFKTSNLNMQISRLYKKGYISKIRKGKSVFVSLVENFWKIKENSIEEKNNKHKKKWDKKWRLLIYDIPEEKKRRRNRLRRYIKDLGYGKVQDSCWVSCYDFGDQLYRFARQENILDYLCIYEGKFFIGKKIDDMVEEIWQLKKLHKRYDELIKNCSEAIETVRTRDAEASQWYSLYYYLYKDYIAILKDDPCLPVEFLKGRSRHNAESIFKKFVSCISKELKGFQP